VYQVGINKGTGFYNLLINLPSYKKLQVCCTEDVFYCNVFTYTVIYCR